MEGREGGRRVGGREEGGRKGGREGDISHKHHCYTTNTPTDSSLIVINLQHVCACVSRNGAGMVLKSTCVFPLSLASAGMGSVEKINCNV